MKKPRKIKQVDRDNPEWGAAAFKRAVPVSALPDSLQKKLRAVRGPQKTPVKERITIRLSRDVVEYFRATGTGWQTRMDEMLQDYVTAHPLRKRKNSQATV